MPANVKEEHELPSTDPFPRFKLTWMLPLK